MLKKIVGLEQLLEVMSGWTGISVTRLGTNDNDRLIGLAERLHRRVVGQGQAAAVAVSETILRSRAGLDSAQQPTGSLLFLGPTSGRKTTVVSGLLSALGDVISALASKTSHISYKNSNLTHILQSSLGGECKILMFVQISQSSSDLGEAICLLNFANFASWVRGFEHGPARKQTNVSELLKYKQQEEKAKHDERQTKKLQDSLQSMLLHLYAIIHFMGTSFICGLLRTKVLEGEGSGIEYEILKTNPILEGFCNAKTSRNDYSSHFGKLIGIHFSDIGKIWGAILQTFLLEKSRVVQCTGGERSYHSFYQLCAGAQPSLREKLKPKSVHEYNCLQQSNYYTILGVNDVEQSGTVMEALDIVYVIKDDQENVWSILAAVLWLGNLTFQSLTMQMRDCTTFLQVRTEVYQDDIDWAFVFDYL